VSRAGNPFASESCSAYGLRVTAPPLPVFWVCGASGAGKSMAAWRLFERLAAAGRLVAYVDIDQLGMLYPAPDDDPERHSLKAAALDALVPGYLASGAQVLVVSGVVDVHAAPHLRSDVELMLCLLSPDPATLRERVLARGEDAADAQAAVFQDRILRGADFVDVAIDSAGLSIEDTVSRLEPLVAGRTRGAKPREPLPPSDADLDVVAVTGPRAVGSSTIGFGLAMQRWGADRRTGFLDLQQLGFLSSNGRPATDITLSIGQLAAMHRLVAACGAELLVVSGHLTVPDRTALRRSLRAAAVTVVRLRADETALRQHVLSRVEGRSARLAGDDLLAAGRRHQDLVVTTAVAEQAALDAAAVDDAVLDVSRRTPDEVVADVAHAVTTGRGRGR
jgi:broad-specificity NMP kinase